ncbi:MAG: (d)CMP kinase [Firmicutes bacterium]|jgi:cytidylate kinase|nr:(d)CMP kinase [Bacillota bacterium]
MKTVFRIAIDGPSGAGKSTVAKAVAVKLGIDYIDTGAMYRAVGLKMLNHGMEMEESDGLKSLLEQTDIDFSAGNIILDGAIVNDLIRTPEVSMAASACSALGMVRAKLVELQRKMGKTKSVVMDGRDIGTNVLTDAEYKYYLTATAEERARRRTAELIEKGQNADFDQVLADIEMRDYNDSHRTLNPLCKAEDAEEIDSTHMTIDEVVSHICSKIV